jgi:hypothetical protein
MHKEHHCREVWDHNKTTLEDRVLLVLHTGSGLHMTQWDYYHAYDLPHGPTLGAFVGVDGP